MLPLKLHGYADYLGGVALLFLPSLFGFAELTVARNFFLLTGIFLIGYSLLTRYHLSALKQIPLGAHMALDTGVGLLILAAPWALHYRTELNGTQALVHYAAGVALIGMVALTRSKTEAKRRREEPRYPHRFGTSSGRA